MWKYKNWLIVSLVSLFFVAVVFIIVIALRDDSSLPVDKYNDNQNKEVHETESIKENMWISVADKSIEKGDAFNFDIYINTQDEELGVFALDLMLESDKFTVDIEKGKDGVDKGVDAGNLAIMANPNDISTNHYRFSGICAKGCAQGDASHVATVYLKALNDFDMPEKVEWLKVRELANTLGHTFNLGEYDGQILIK